MFISSQLVYLQLHKTGCTHVAGLLKEIVDGRQIGKHDRLPDGFEAGGRLIMGSIRDPWDWYVSLWAYGCDGKGALYKRLCMTPKTGISEFIRHPVSALSGLAIRKRGRSDAWRRVYLSSDDASRFREWLRMLLDPGNRHRLGEGYGRSPISLFAGFLTYRYVFLFSEDPRPIYSKSIATQGDLRAFLKEHSVLDYTIRNERLEEDLVEGLRRCGIVLNEKQLRLIYEAGRSNTSSRNRQLDYYYDRETVELVGERERTIIEKYGYTAPLVE